MKGLAPIFSFCRISLMSCLALLVVVGCKPVLDSLNPTSGPPGTVVETDGSNLLLATVKWDANSANERDLPSSFLSAKFFTVPLDANNGPHTVRLYGKNEYSDNSINFNVIAGVIRPEPRLDDITVAYFDINSSNEASMILMVHGANIDVGATIHIGDVPQPTSYYRLLRNQNMNATDPSTLGYPIFHYSTIWCFLSEITPGSELKVLVENLDGEKSESAVYKVAANMDELDSDGDGLPDSWEENGYDADGDGTIDVDLPALGADPKRKDLFIEVDWMANAAPNNAIWAAIENTFTNAPILNSDGSQGVAIHIDRGVGSGGGGGDIIPFTDATRYDDNTPNPNLTYSNFYTIKQNNFDPDRLNVFRYALFVWNNGYWLGSSGMAEGFIANDFFVSLANWGADGQRTDFQTSTFIHELGHTLNLRHGGVDHGNSKDNYNSIMNYGNGWIIWNGQNNVFSPSTMGGIDTDCNLFDVDGVFTYSQGQRSLLDENTLNENLGVCDNIAIDWNQNGTIENNVAFNVGGSPALEIIEDYADWANIEIDFRQPGSGWNNN